MSEVEIVGAYLYGSNDSKDFDIFVQVSRIPNDEDQEDLEDIKEGVIEGLRRSIPRLKGSRNIDAKNMDIDLSFIHVDEDSKVMDWCEYDNLAEANNCLLTTFSHHRFNTRAYDEAPVHKQLTQNVSLKLVKNLRTILTFLSRTQYRDEVKRLLKYGTFAERIEFIAEFVSSNKLQSVDSFNKNLSDQEITKDLAFCFIQLHALIQGFEVFTKRDACMNYPDLAKYILRTDGSEQLEALESFIFEIFNDLSSNLEIFRELDAVRYAKDQYGCLNKQEQLIEITED